MRNPLKKPLLQCLVLGGLIAAWQLYTKAPPEIYVSQDEIQNARQELLDTFGGRQANIDEDRIAEKLAEDKIMYQQARSAGYDKLPSVINRLGNVAAFLQIVPEDSSLEQRYQAALDMGLDETDIVVRRQMITLYRSALKNSVAVSGPSEEEIVGYYQQNASQFERSARYSFSHIYLQDMGDEGQQAAAELRAGLSGEALPPVTDAIALGDVFYGGHHFTSQNQKQIARQLGDRFARSIVDVTPRQWSQPIQSAFGWHLVWVDTIAPKTMRALDEVRTIITRELRMQEQNRLYQQALDKLRSKYRIIIEPVGENVAKSRAVSRKHASKNTEEPVRKHGIS